MTIQSATARVSFACNSVSTIFPVPIQAYLPTDFLVIATNAGLGTETTLTLNSDYTLVPSGTLAPTAWTLTTQTGQLPSPYVTGYTLQVILNPTQTQITQYVQGQAFPSLAVQTNIDRLTQMIIRQQDLESRSIQAPDGDVNPLMILPPAASRANLAPLFDANGNLVMGIIPTTVLTQSIFNTFLSAAPPPQLFFPQTAAEIIAGVTPVTLVYPELDVRRYGALATNTGAANATAIQQGISVLAQHTFGELLIAEGLVLNIAQVTFNSLSKFNVRCDGVLNSTQAQQGTPFTDQRSLFQGATTPLKFTSCNDFKLYGKGYINNGFTDALYFLSCTDFDISIDLRGTCTNAAIATGNSTLAGVKMNLSNQFKIHDMTVDSITSQNMNNVTDVYFQWGNNFEITGCTDFQIANVLSRKAGYGAFYIGLNCFDFSVIGCIGELCSGTAFTATWNAPGVQPSRATIIGNIWRYNQEDGMAIANQSGTNASVAITYCDNVSIFNGWCNCSQGTTTQAANGGSGIGTFQFLDDVVVNGNTSFEHTTVAMAFYGCLRVAGAGNSAFSSIATTNVIGLWINSNCSDIKLSSGCFSIGNTGGQSVLMTDTNNDVQLSNWAFPAGQISISGTYSNCKFSQVVATSPGAVSGLFDWVDCALTVSGASQNGLVVGAPNVKLARVQVSSPSTAISFSGVNYGDLEACAGTSTAVSGTGIGIQVNNSNGTNLRNCTGTSAANGPGIAVQGTCDRVVLIGCKGSSATANSLNMASAGVTNAVLMSFTNLAGGGPALTGATFLTGMNIP